MLLDDAWSTASLVVTAIQAGHVRLGERVGGVLAAGATHVPLDLVLVLVAAGFGAAEATDHAQNVQLKSREMGSG